MAADSDAEASSLFEQLMGSRNREGSFPFIMGFSSSRRRESDDNNNNPDEESEEGNPTLGRIVLINPFTQGMIVIETSSRNLDDLFRGVSGKEGLKPASKASIDAMPKVVITEGDQECSICLEGWEIGGEAREMPCKHKYHSNCIEKWLGIHGSCPVCRFKMPVDEEDLGKKQRNVSSGGNGEGEEDQERDDNIGFERQVWVSFSFDRRRNSRTTRADSATSTTESDHSSGTNPSAPQDGSVDNQSSSNEEI